MEAFPYKRLLVLATGLGAARVVRACRALQIEAIGLGTTAGAVPQVQDADQIIEFDREQPDYQRLAEELRAKPMDAAHLGLAASKIPKELIQCVRDAGLPLIGRADLDEPAYWWRAAAKRENIKLLPILIASESSDIWEEANGRDLFPCTVYFDDATHFIADEAALVALRERAGSKLPLAIQQYPKRSRRLAVVTAKDHRDEVYPIVEVDHSLHAEGRLVFAETPCPELTLRPDGEAIRQMMFDHTVRLLRNAPGPELYAVVFSLDAAGSIALEDVRTGLIRMHSLVERVSGLDLARLQIELSAKALTRTSLESIQTDGCAVGALIYEDSQKPAHTLQPPALSDAQARFETALNADGVNPESPLLFSVVSSALLRHRALLMLDRILAQTQIDTEPPLRNALRTLLRTHVFRSGRYDRDTGQSLVIKPVTQLASA